MLVLDDQQLRERVGRRVRRATLRFGSAIAAHVVVGVSTMALAVLGGASPSVWLFGAMAGIVTGPLPLVARERRERRAGSM
jgi:hypothetical protein